jgi:predicted TIM-barrel fold metal-dependent hydrolase
MGTISHVPQRVIDTHIHLWDPDRLAYPWLSAGFDELPGRYLPRDFQRDAADVNLIATVHVQAEIDHDLDPVLEPMLTKLRRRSSDTPRCASYFRHRDRMCWPHARSPRFRGIRQEAWFDPKSRRADIPRVNLLDDISWAGGSVLAEQGLVFELLVWPSQLDQAASILHEIPELVVVLEHRSAVRGERRTGRTRSPASSAPSHQHGKISAPDFRPTWNQRPSIA